MLAFARERNATKGPSRHNTLHPAAREHLTTRSSLFLSGLASSKCSISQRELRLNRGDRPRPVAPSAGDSAVVRHQPTSPGAAVAQGRGREKRQRKDGDRRH